MTPTPRRRGRPLKYHRPSRVVALTLPDDVLDQLRKLDSDLGWAIVGLVRKRGARGKTAEAQSLDSELVAISSRQFLIVVNRAALKRLPGIQAIPLDRGRAFLALGPDCGMSDLELALLDRLEDGVGDPKELEVLRRFRAQLRRWRRDPALTFERRAIIVAKRLKRHRAS